MIKAPLVTVITPCWNGAQFLPEALASAATQTFRDFELLIVDDGSTDSTPGIAQEWSARDPVRFRYIRQENQGLAVARNTAIREGRGELFALLDCDDVWAPERLAEGVRLMDAHPEIGLVHADIRRMDEKGAPLSAGSRAGEKKEGWIFDGLYTRRSHVACPTVLFRRKCVEACGGFDPALSRLGCEDREFWLRFANKFPFAYVPQTLASYRMSAGSMSRNMEKMLKARMYVLEKHAAPGMRGWALRREALAAIYQEMAEMAGASNNAAEARNWKRRMLAACPWKKRFWGAMARA